MILNQNKRRTLLFLPLFLSFIFFCGSRSVEAQKRDEEFQPLNILTFGGSVTWGTAVEHEETFPELLAKKGHRVTNKALRATGSFFPAVCLESLMGNDNTAYDVILLEFTINGVRAFDWLVKRLRAKFPHSIIIYVHLYSFRHNIIDAIGKSPYDHGYYNDFSHKPNVTWYWKPVPDRQHTPPQVRDIPKEWDMHVYNFPLTRYPIDTQELFAGDWHHLSPKGHEKVADDLMEMIKEHIESEGYIEPILGTWGLGDTCHIWFNTGETNLLYIGAEMNQMGAMRGNNIFEGKYVLEFPPGETGGIMLPNYDPRAPLWVHYMSTGGDKYPNALFEMWDRKFIVDHQLNTHIIGEKIETKQIGWAEKADNFITVKPNDAGSPFRLVAIGFCGACYQEDIGGVH